MAEDKMSIQALKGEDEKKVRILGFCNDNLV